MCNSCIIIDRHCLDLKASDNNNIVFLNSSYLLDYLSLSFSQTVRVLHHHELDSTDDGRAMLLPAGLASGTAIVSPNGACTSGLTALVAQAAHGQGPPSRLASTERSFSAGPSFMPSECIRWSSVSSGRPAPSICWSRKFWLTKEYFFKYIFSVAYIPPSFLF